MKKLNRKNLRSLLMIALIVVMLAGMLGGCFGKGDVDETLDNLDRLTTDPSDSTEEPTEEPTEAPTDAPANVVMGTVTTDNLNIRSSPSTDSSTVIRQLAVGDRLEITEQKLIDGVNWGRIEEGWINLNYVAIDGQTAPDPTEPQETEPAATEAPESNTDNESTASGTTGTITASELRIREGAGTSYDTVGSYKQGDKVTILETKDGWGRTSKGWISMKYVDLEGTSDPDKTDDKDDKDTSKLVTNGKTSILGYGVVEDVSSLNVRTGPGTDYDKVDFVSEGQRLPYYQKSGSWVRISKGWVSTKYFDIDEKVESGTTGTVNTAELNIREGAGSKYDAVGKYKKGDKITILEVKNNWGKTDKGWVSLNYVILGDSKDDDDKTTTKIESDGKTKVLGYGVVTSGALNLRSGPSSEKDDIGNLDKGDRVAYYLKSGNWVRTKDGWVSSKYLYIEGTKGDGAGSGTATGDQLNVRTGPGTGFQSVGKLSKGDKVEILAQVTVGSETWGYTKNGWVSMKYIEMAS